MIDLVRKKGDGIDVGKLEEALGCEVVETSALKGIGLKETAEKAMALAKSGYKTTPPAFFSDTV
jgi:ferrous iron transport protein B